MKKLEFSIGIILRVVLLAHSIDSLVQEGEFGFVWNAIGYFTLSIVMIYSIIAQVYMLATWKPREKEYYQFD